MDAANPEANRQSQFPPIRRTVSNLRRRIQLRATIHPSTATNSTKPQVFLVSVSEREKGGNSNTIVPRADVVEVAPPHIHFALQTTTSYDLSPDADRQIFHCHGASVFDRSRAGAMAANGAPPSDSQLFELLGHLLQEVESLTNQEEVELRAKIEQLGVEVTKVPKLNQPLDELEIARQLDNLSAKLDDVDEMISSAMAADPQVQSLLSSTADVWLPVITASSDQRCNFSGSVDDPEGNSKNQNGLQH